MPPAPSSYPQELPPSGPRTGELQTQVTPKFELERVFPGTQCFPVERSRPGHLVSYDCMRVRAQLLDWV